MSHDGRRPGRLRPVRAARILLALAFMLAAAILTPPNAIGASSNGARLFAIHLPVEADGARLGSVDARVGIDGSYEVEKRPLLELLTPALTDGAAARLAAALSGEEVLTRRSFDGTRVGLAFDPQRVALVAKIPLEDRNSVRLGRAGADQRPPRYDQVEAPSAVSGFLNMYAGPRVAETSTSSADALGADVLMDGAVRAGGLVFAGGASWATDDERVRKGELQLVKDLPKQALRIAAGDVAGLSSTFISSPDLLGLAISHDVGTFQPWRNTIARSSRSFSLSTASTVEVYVDDRLERRLRLAPGRYTLADLQVVDAVSNVRLVIESSTGEVEELSFSAFFDSSLLRPGIASWTLAAGWLQPSATEGFDYDLAVPALSAGIDLGVADWISVGADAFATDAGQVFSASLISATALGLSEIDLAVSNDSGKSGWAVDLDYQPSFLEILREPGRSLNISATYVSSDFRNSFGSYSSDYDQGDALYLDARYTDALFSGKASLSFSAGSSFRNGAALSHRLSAGVGFQLTRRVGVNLTGRYQFGREVENEASVLLGFSVALGDYGSARASFDSLDDGVAASWHASNQAGGIGTWRASLFGRRSAIDEGEVSAAGSYTGNRYTVSASASKNLADESGALTGLRAQTLVGTSLAFAGGRVGLTRPIRDSFAIVEPHSTLSESRVVLDPGGKWSGDGSVSDALGPAIASDIGSYRYMEIVPRVEDIPPGYDLGGGTFALWPPLHSGYVLTLGSERNVAVVGTLKGRDGEPVATRSGRISSPDDEGFRTQIIFTNRAGRFSVNGLVPEAHYEVEFGGGQGRTSFATPAKSTGLVRLGTLSLEEG